MRATAKRHSVKKVHRARPFLAACAALALTLVLTLALAAAGCTTATPSAATRADNADTETLKKRLNGDPRFSRLKNVSVDPARGVVKLAGEVASKADRADAGRLASSIPGAAVVYNEIQVHSPRR